MIKIPSGICMIEIVSTDIAPMFVLPCMAYDREAMIRDSYVSMSPFQSHLISSLGHMVYNT
jgi:hypothetical protein